MRVRAGSQDCGLSVWSTETTRPKLVTKNIFSQSVLDIAWAPDGYTLLCCSTDGTAVSLHFDPKEVRHGTAHAWHTTNTHNTSTRHRPFGLRSPPIPVIDVTGGACSWERRCRRRRGARC